MTRWLLTRDDIRTFAFDDQNSDVLGTAAKTEDNSLKKLSEKLWCIHDDFIDHPISVTAEGWNLLTRIVAFLGTTLDAGDDPKSEFWPFRDEREWQAHARFADEFRLPDYDESVHGQPVRCRHNAFAAPYGFWGHLGRRFSLLVLVVDLGAH